MKKLLDFLFPYTREQRARIKVIQENAKRIEQEVAERRKEGDALFANGRIPSTKEVEAYIKRIKALTWK